MLQGIWEVLCNGEATLTGTVEMDETFIAGKERNKQESKSLKAGRGKVGKTAVVGAKECGGEVAVKPVPATDAKTLGGFVAETVSRAPRYTQTVRALTGVSGSTITMR